MIDIGVVLSSLIAQAPLVAVVIITLYYTLDKKIGKLERRIERLENEVVRLENEVMRLDKKIEAIGGVLSGQIKSLARAFYSYSDMLIRFLSAKGLVAEPEAVLLRGALDALIPVARSKYYTEEIREKLLKLLRKEIKDYTWDDVAELEKIAEAIYKEYEATGREDLLDYYPKLRMYIAIIQGLLTRREMERREVTKQS
ncbi:hypothetical protein [Pyrobaculum ferrireducens]|uniref:PaREP5ab n=1 Tax=Pyrobaculum ferrireducens TaxID=1104324 RepID=G7VGI4_9CREN|nr:hypothetical protein [Pyrobaculum ferrireducens]AET33084.1 paREP5ab [Pyrobaculum ferrireducens]